MSIKKTGFSYFVCVLFGIISAGFIIAASFDAAKTLGQKDNLIFAGIAIVAGIAVIAAITAFHKVLEKMTKNGGIAIPEASGFTEGVFLFLMVVGTFLMRVIYLASRGGIFTTDTSLLDAAVDGSGLSNYSNIEILYVKALGYAIALFGTKIVASVYFQIICQMIIIVCLYYSVKLLMSRLPAALAIVFYAYIPYSVHLIQENNPQVFMTMLFAIGILLIILLSRLSHFMIVGSAKSLLAFIGTGLYCGFLIYLDPVGLSLIFVAIAMYKFAQNEDADLPGQKVVPQSIVTILGIILGLGGSLFVKSLLSGTDIVNELNNYLAVFTSGIEINTMISLPFKGSLFSLIMVCVAFPWIVRIFKIQRDFGSPIMIVAFVAVVLSLLGLSSIEYNGFMTYLWCIFATFGIFSVARNDIQREDVEEAKKEFEKVTKTPVFTKKPNDNIVTKSANLQNNNKITSKTPQVKLTSNVKTNIREMEASLDFLKKGEPQAVSKPVAPKKPEVVEKMEPKPENASNGMVINDHKSAAILRTGSGENAPKTAIVTQTNSVTIEAPTVSPTPTQTIAHPPVQTTIPPTMQPPIPSNGINQKQNDKPEPVANTDKPQSVSAVPPKTNAVIPPAVKYGRRLDYKTAKVSKGDDNPLLGKGNPALKAATVTQQVIDAKKPVPTPPKEDTMKTEEQNEVETVTAPVRPALVTAPETVPAVAPGMNMKKPEEAQDSKNNQEHMSKSSTTLIHNPLPTPKKHVAKELEFDILPQSTNMHFDIVDLKEYDHFDIN